MPIYIALTCSKAKFDDTYRDFDSNSVTSRINVNTFNKCWSNVHYNKGNDGLENMIGLPEDDNHSKKGVYLVWSVTNEIKYDQGMMDLYTPALNKTFIGVVTDEVLKEYLPKTAKDLELQRKHFGIDN
ncbi:MAG: hypothetical protein ACP5NV_02760 [Candidatus Woesearchaeota archaeon]